MVSGTLLTFELQRETVESARKRPAISRSHSPESPSASTANESDSATAEADNQRPATPPETDGAAVPRGTAAPVRTDRRYVTVLLAELFEIDV